MQGTVTEKGVRLGARSLDAMDSYIRKQYDQKIYAAEDKSSNQADSFYEEPEFSPP